MTAMGSGITILGGGCAGLSLANALVEGAGVRGPIRVIEPRTEYTRDRTWCFWDVEPHAWNEAVRHRWSAWDVRLGHERVRCQGRRHRYCEIPGDAFYEIARERLARDSRVELHDATRALSVVPEGDGVRVTTSAGDHLAALVFDSRPRSRALRAARGPGLLQHFAGLRVRVSRPVFDPTTVTLMDFEPVQREGIHFIYLLPYAADQALVEATVFSPAPLEAKAYDAAVSAYLERRFGVTSFEVTDREQGVIPMHAVPDAPRHTRVIPIGTRGGAVRPSTGYAFLAIQREARALARAVAEDGSQVRRPELRSRLLRGLDAVFLEQLRRFPRRAPRLFLDLFDRVPPDALARFLMERPRSADLAAVVGAMPRARFARQGITSAWEALSAA